MNSSSKTEPENRSATTHGGGDRFADWPLGMFSWFGFELKQEQRLRLIGEAGFKATSFWLAKRWEEEHGVDYRRVADAVRRSGLKLEFIHGDYRGCNAIWDPSASSRRTVRQDYHYYVDFCRDNRIPTVVLHLTRGPHPPPPTEAGLEFLTDLTAHAARYGVRIALENTRHQEHLDAALEAIHSPFLGLCYDSSHDFLYGEPVGAVLERWGRRLFVTHFSDNDGEADRHWIPDLENPLWDRVASAFPARTFSGAIHMEVLGYLQADRRPRVFVEKAYTAARRLKSLVGGDATGSDA